MGATKSKSSSKDRSSNARKEQSRSRIPASAASSARSSSSSPLSHSRTVSSTSTSISTARGRSRSIFGEGPRPTTAPEGHAPEFSSQLRNIVEPPAVPSIPPPLLRTETSPVSNAGRNEGSKMLRMPTFDIILANTTRSTSAENAETSGFGRPPSDREPGYRSKRPPPIASNLAPPQSTQLSKSPSSARSLKRTLTEKLFGRKPSNARRSIVRAALSDGPDSLPAPPVPPISVPFNGTAPRPSRLPDELVESSRATTSQPAPTYPTLVDSPKLAQTEPQLPEQTTVPELVPIEVLQQRHASFAALEGSASSSPELERAAETTKSTGRSENAGQGFGAAFDFGLDLPRSDIPRVSVNPPPQAEGTQLRGDAEAMRRLSVDSASSYGSIGFTDRTDRTFSSRSSPPPMDELMRKRSDVPKRSTVEERTSTIPAPLRPHSPDAMADSPTDPFCVDGHLSPMLPKDFDTTLTNTSLDAQVVSPASASAEDKRASSSASSDSDFEDVDSTPPVGFRPRKDSLAGAPPPLFHKSGVPARVDSKPVATEDDSRDNLLTHAHHKPRQDSLASVNGRNAIKATCRGCSKPILGMQKSVSSADGRLSGKYHKECFACATCKEPFATAEFYVHADQPYCGHHYHQLEDSLCASCNQGIEGLYMETANVAGRGKEKHHPACLKCATCRVQLTNDYFELCGMVYCERDAFRLAKHPRVHSRGPARPSPLVREYIRSAGPGSIHGTNFPERRIGRPMLEVR